MKHFLLVLTVFSATLGKAQTIFSEDFQSTTGGAIPTGWTVIDNDGLPVHANVSQFTDGWISAVDFNDPADTVAMSTSWYSPAGSSDDWMITPPIVLTTNNILSWEAQAQDPSFPDGYEVRISTTTPTITEFLSNAALFSIPNEMSGSWAQHSVDLQAAGYSNQTVFIAWRNTSNDQFILKVDDIVVTGDSTATALENRFDRSGMTVFPNPASGSFRVVVEGVKGESLDISLVDAQGKLIAGDQMVATDDKMTIPFEGQELAAGLYFVRVSASSQVFTERLHIAK